MGNFEFVRDEWPQLYDDAARAEHAIYADPRMSCVYARRTLEFATHWVYRADGTLRAPYRHDLAARLAEPTFQRLVGPAIGAKMDLIALRPLAARLQLGQLNDAPGVERLRRQVQDIATALLQQTAIPAIQAQAVLLEEIAGHDWWVDVRLPMLELVRRRIRGLVALIEKSRRAIVYTDFADELGEHSEIRMRAVQTGIDRQRFDVTQLTENGVMEPGRLYESPFTDSAPTGPDDLFESADVERIISILRSVNSTAGVEETIA